MRLCLLLFMSAFMVSCGNHYQRPTKMYIRDFIGIDPKIQEVVVDTISELNTLAGESFIFVGSGEKPVTVKEIASSEIGDEVFAHARYLEYHCLIQVRDDLEQRMRSVVNPVNPQLVSESAWKKEARKIIMHELGHCAGLNHVNDPDNLMNPNYSYSWNNQTLEDFANLLKEVTR